MDLDDPSQDICRVCRSEASPEKPLYHPCICTGSIKFIHQDCLVQWLKFSKKEYCELCNYRFSFIPIYSPDMPKRLPFRDIVSGLAGNLYTAVRYWFHYTLVAIAWLVVVPLSAYRIFKCLFNASLSALLTLPFDLLSTENLTTDEMYGCLIVACTLCAFISVVWLRDQILREGPDWLEQPADAGNDENALMEPAAVDDGGDEHENDAELVDMIQADENEDQLEEEDDDIQGEPNVVNGVANEQNGQMALVQEDLNWNWERNAEELTWERVFGLDGSLIFLEHVFWVISLNTLFIIIFAFCPYHIGLLVLSNLSFTQFVSKHRFEGIICTICGYALIGITLVLLHALLFKFRKTRRILGQSYLIIKVALLSIFEIGVFPLVCGWWLDVCSLPLMGSNVTERELSFRNAPGTSMFVHWLVGLTYVFYFASFILLLKDILRPKLLWFLDSINDPDFNPIQEMIHIPIVAHTRKFFVSLVVFIFFITLMIYLPVCATQKLLPNFLPYNIILSSNEAPSNEFANEYLLMQLILLALLDHNHLKQSIKVIIKHLCIAMAWLLDLRSYLLGDVPIPEPENVQPSAQALPVRHLDVHSDDDEEQANVAHARFAAQVVEEEGEEAEIITSDEDRFIRPNLFHLRVFALMLLSCVSVFLSGLFIITVPVIIGRKLIGFWTMDAKVHELNTVACGLYVLVLFSRLCTISFSWLPRGWNAIVDKLREGTRIMAKAAVAGFLLLGIIPLLVGLLFDVVFILPFRVSANQTPVFYLCHDWVFGILYLKVICGIAMISDWPLKDTLEEMYQNGLVNMNLNHIVQKIAFPVIMAFGHILCIPYLFVNGVLPLFDVSYETRSTLLRQVYPFLLFGTGIVYLIYWQIYKFCHLYEHIKNDKYLVGRRLVNYDPNKRKN